MKKKTQLMLSMTVLALGFGVLNPTVFAESKAKLAHLVMEHEMKIAALEEAQQGSGNGQSEEAVSEHILNALYREVEITLPRYTEFWNEEIDDMDKINVTKFDVLDSNGEVKILIYLEGDYGWKQDERGIFEPGRYLAYNFINTMNVTAEMYGVDVVYEFYQNGERVGAAKLTP